MIQAATRIGTRSTPDLVLVSQVLVVVLGDQVLVLVLVLGGQVLVNIPAGQRNNSNADASNRSVSLSVVQQLVYVTQNREIRDPHLL